MRFRGFEAEVSRFRGFEVSRFRGFEVSRFSPFSENPLSGLISRISRNFHNSLSYSSMFPRLHQFRSISMKCDQVSSLASSAHSASFFIILVILSIF